MREGKKTEDAGCVRDEITGDGFPEKTSGFFSRIQQGHLCYLTPLIDRLFRAGSARVHDPRRSDGNFVTIFHLVRHQERKERGRGARVRGGMRGKNSSVHSACIHVRRTYSFVFFYSHLYPTLPKELARSFKVAAWLFVPATQTQFAFRPLSFLHDTLVRGIPCVCITAFPSFLPAARFDFVKITPSTRGCLSRT